MNVTKVIVYRGDDQKIHVSATVSRGQFISPAGEYEIAGTSPIPPMSFDTTDELQAWFQELRDDGNDVRAL
jgi:hypothetical protein